MGLRIDIGLSLLTEVEAPFLNIGMTLAIFRLSGQIPVLIERLKIFSSAGAIMGTESLTNLVEKSSYPVEFVFLSDLIVTSISVWDVFDNIK